MIHINQPTIESKGIVRRPCHDCMTNSRFITFFYKWHGVYQTCLRCGREYCDGKMVLFDPTPQARQKNIIYAKRLWQQVAR
jgi:hypothetical protein